MGAPIWLVKKAIKLVVFWRENTWVELVMISPDINWSEWRSIGAGGQDKCREIGSVKHKGRAIVGSPARWNSPNTSRAGDSKTTLFVSSRYRSRPYHPRQPGIKHSSCKGTSNMDATGGLFTMVNQNGAAIASGGLGGLHNSSIM